MVTPKQIRDKTMTPEKKKGAKYDIFAYYVGRQISYVLSVPFISLGVKPNVISLLSLVPSIVGFFFLSFGQTVAMRSIGGCFFMLWNFLDGVDGNAARYYDKPSKMGRLWDATSGYVAGMLLFFSMGISAMHAPCAERMKVFALLPDYWYVVMGGMTSVLMMFYRLVMHKKMVLYGEDAGEGLNNKNTYSSWKIVALNITSTAGMLQVFMLICILTDRVRLFTAFYFCVQFFITIWTLARMLTLTSDDYLA